MPYYDYRCLECQYEAEEFQKISEESLTKCPKCQKNGYQKKIPSVGLAFKGSGFYITDYARSSKPAEPSSSTCCPCGKDKGSCQTKNQS